MKVISRFIVCFIFCFLFNLKLFSQDSKISLPDVKTVVDGDGTGQKAVAPDFINDFETPLLFGEIEPEVPEERNLFLEKKESDDLDLFSEFSKNCSVGFSFPYCVETSVNIEKKDNKTEEISNKNYNLFDIEPFALDFDYSSKTFGTKNENSSLFYSKCAKLNMNSLFFENREKLFALDGGIYFFDVENGLQGNNLNNFAIAQRNLFLNLNFQKIFGNKIFKIKTDASYYSRNLISSSNENDNIENEYFINPDLFFIINFDNDSSIKKFVVSLKNTYEKTNFNLSYKGTLESSALFEFNKSSLNIDFGLSFALNIEHSIFNIAPFIVNYSYGKIDDDFYLTAKTGVESYLPKISELEQMYKFSYFDKPLTNTSDFIVDIYLKKKIINNLFIIHESDFKKTFYNHGNWQADYSNLNSYGLYSFTQVSRMSYALSFGFEWIYNYAKISALYKLNLFDKNVLDATHNYEVSLSFFNKLQIENRWMITLNAKGTIGGIDDVPDISANVNKKLNRTMELEISANDMIKFIFNKLRNYSLVYYTDGGNLSIKLKLNL